MSEMFKIKNGIGLKPKNLATIVNPVAGDVACDESDNKIKFYDVSTSTWKEMRAVDSVNGQTGTVVLTKSDVGLSNVDNTSDANKPISTATQAALDNIKQDLDIFYEQDMERLANTADFSTGNNAAFMGGGTLQGTLSLETVAPISGTKSLKYVQAVGSVNDYFASPVIDLDLKQKNNTSAMTFYFEYNGNDNDGRFVVYDVTNSREIASEVSFVKVANKATRYSISFYIPDNCNQIRWGYKVLVQNTGKILLVDDVELSMNPFQAKELSNNTAWSTPTTITITSTGTSPTKGTIIQDSVRWKRDGDEYLVEYRFQQSTGGGGGSGNYTVALPVGVEIDPSVFNSSLGTCGSVIGYGEQFLESPTAYPTQFFPYYVNGSTTSFRVRGADNSTTGWEWSGVAGSLNRPQALTLNLRFKGKNLQASSSNVLIPSDTFSSDSAPLTYASSSQYNLTTLANAPIGTYITFTYAANTNTRTQTTTRPTQTDADMNVNGMQIFTRAYNAASTAASPAAFAIQIGKGMKGTSLNLYKSVGKVTAGTTDVLYQGTSQSGIGIKDYNETSGILVIDSGYMHSSSANNTYYLFSDTTVQTNGYLTINAGRTLPLLAVPTPLVAYLKDVKPSGTGGGTFTAGAWQTRTLNTIEGDSSIVSLSANQFTLAAGKYEIEASAPALYVNSHKVKLRNITMSTDQILGSSAKAETSSLVGNVTSSALQGLVVLTSTSSFEVQHQCFTTRSSDGFGSATSFGVNEVYTTVKITRLQ